MRQETMICLISAKAEKGKDMKKITKILLACMLAASMLALPVSAADETETDTQAATTVAAEIEIEEETATETETTTEDAELAEEPASGMTEEELEAAVIKVAEAIGAYEDDVPGAAKVKQWIFDNLASIVGALMALSMLIITPVGRKVFKSAVKILKTAMEEVDGWKNALVEKISANEIENRNLRAAVNELMATFKRQTEDLTKRAEAAEDEAQQLRKQLLDKETETAEVYAKCARTCEAVCRAVLVVAKPLEMTVQKSKGLDEMQKHEIFSEYRDGLDLINAILNEPAEGGEAANGD